MGNFSTHIGIGTVRQ